MSFWELVWLWFGVALAAYLFVVVALIVDLFRDPRASGLVRAAWTLYLVCLPVLAVIVYLVVRGRDVGERPFPAQPVTPGLDAPRAGPTLTRGG